MIELDVASLILLAGVAFVAGGIDAIAGGGGLLVLPTLLSLGFPPVAALATNKLQGVFGTAMASLSFLRAGLVNWRTAAPGCALAALGSVLAARVVQDIDTTLLERLMPGLLVAAAAWFLFSPSLDDVERQQRISRTAFAAGPAFAIGFYDGIFGPGAGSLYTFAAVALLGVGARRAVGEAKLLNVSSNLFALLAFAASGAVIWQAGLVMVCGSGLGAWLGSRLAINKGAALIRPMLAATSIALAASLARDAFFGST
ncbi:MAG: hypothetical protein CSB44_05720 [Gammaproteobacteria bacterium]|nr:MAG: hypothetical protein CSB44_05720 [Gammaproteobacteria bacterium]PIE36821.1 MAG: hypothetical protein CSA54_03170 [Gammaproteobacteria bacterium]